MYKRIYKKDEKNNVLGHNNYNVLTGVENKVFSYLFIGQYITYLFCDMISIKPE